MEKNKLTELYIKVSCSHLSNTRGPTLVPKYTAVVISVILLVNPDMLERDPY
jgi:hypothetical protein